jgi:Ni/Fe-hydrogenase 1 B-type cytochrome subunit
MVAALHPTPEAARGRPLDRAHPVYVYAWPVRLWHWISAIGVVTLAITGFLIARPIPSPPGEAIDHFVMGYTRGIHLSAAWLVTVGFALRLYVAVLGKTGSREIFVAPVWRGDFWRAFWAELRWYTFLTQEPEKHVGHNPIAQLAMLLGFTLTLIGMIATGFALHAEAQGIESGTYALFGWVFDLAGSSQVVRTIHHGGMWVMTLFTMTHVYAVFREEIMSRQTIISSMTNGYRYFKDDRP